MKIIDYLFYRVYSFYNKHPNEIPVFSATLIITLMVYATILSTFAISSLFIKFNIPSGIKGLIIILLVSIFIPIWKRYGNKEIVVALKENYMIEDSENKRIKGWLFSIYLILIRLIPISIGFLRHNLGMEI